jgi:hypothetical protein
MNDKNIQGALDEDGLTILVMILESDTPPPPPPTRGTSAITPLIGTPLPPHPPPLSQWI